MRAAARSVAGALALAVTFVPVSAQQAERVDLNAIYKIKDEGFQRSSVMEIMSWLTDVYGPRLTNSPGFRKAGDWAVKEMTSWGLVNVKLQPFGPFGRGWANDKFYMMATTPGGSLPVIGYPQAWTSSTNGVVSGDAVFATIDTPEDIATWKGKLKGKVPPRRPRCATSRRSSNRRRSATPHDQLRDLERETDSVGRGGRGGRGGFPGGRGGAQAFAQTRTQFLKDEGVLAILTPGHGIGGTVFVGGGGSREAERARHGAGGDDRRRALRPHPPHAAEETSRCGSRWRSRTRSTTTPCPSTSSARLPEPTRPTRS